MEIVRKWEDLNMDCLVNILGRVDTENLLLDVPYVCKSWYKATCDPRCWIMLNFVNDFSSYEFWVIPVRLTRKYRLNTPSSDAGFIKYVVEKRGNGFTTFVKLPCLWTEELLVHISKKCPNLRTLKLPWIADLFSKRDLVSFHVCKWKRLERITMSSHNNLCAILAQISVHCKNFGALEVLNGEIGGDEASALVTFTPNLKSLSLRYADIGKKALLKILNGCKKLEYLDARNCVGFEENDDDVFNCAAHIHTLMLQGSTLFKKYDSSSDYYEIFDDCQIYDGDDGCF